MQYYEKYIPSSNIAAVFNVSAAHAMVDLLNCFILRVYHLNCDIRIEKRKKKFAFPILLSESPQPTWNYGNSCAYFGSPCDLVPSANETDGTSLH